MSWKKIAFLALVLAVLAAAIVLVNQKDKEKKGVEGILLDIPAGAIEKIELVNQGGRFTFSRQGTLWRLDAPLEAKADPVALESILDNFCQLKYDRLVEENAARLEDFGLDKPEIELKLVAKNRPAATILLGMKNAIDDSSYARLANGSKVVTISSYKRRDLDKDLFAFRDKKVLGIDTITVGAMEYHRGGSGISFTKKEGGWFLEKPVYSRARESKVSDILAAVSALEALSFAPVPVPDARGGFGLDRPELVAEFRSPAGSQRLTVGRMGEKYYALADGAAEVCWIAKDFMDKFGPDAAAFRETKVAPFYAFDVKEIAFRRGPIGFSARKEAVGGWKLDKEVPGRSPSQDKIERLLTSLSELEAKEFVDGAKALPLFPTHVILKTEDPADPGKQGTIVIEFAAPEGETVIVRNPSLPYQFRAGKEIVEKLPGKLEDLCEDEAKAAEPGN